MYCVVLDGNKTRVLRFEETKQKGHTRKVPCFITFDDFKNYYCNQFVLVGEKQAAVGSWWLRQPGRRQYNGIIFEPGAPETIDGRLNLWRGWGVQPAPGAWPRMRQHLSEVLAGGDDASDAYILKWCAWAVQHPADRAEASIVFKGKKGAGKGTLGNAMCRIFGQHGTHISSAEHLAGRFNGHLRDACFLFADEAFWPGDRSAEGSLKRLITEPDLFIEAKGKDGITTRNKLHVMMASNEDWIVPAGQDERRYAVFEVADHRKQDEHWFRPIYDELDRSGYEAMLFDLLAMDLGEWHPRRIPLTAALLDQQSQGLRAEDMWWCELLETGSLWGADPRRPECAVSNAWEENAADLSGRMVKRLGLYDQARSISPTLRKWSDHLLGSHLSKHGCDNGQKVMRRRGWRFPPLDRLRREWEQRFPGWAWRDAHLAEWNVDGVPLVPLESDEWNDSTN